MTDSTKEILDKLLSRQRILRKELAALESLVTLYHGLDNQESSESPIDDAQLNLKLNRKSRAAQTATIARAIDTARRILLQENRPMKRGELVRKLEAEGHNLPGTDKNKVLGTNIWRSGKFRLIENEGYWPKDVPYQKRTVV